MISVIIPIRNGADTIGLCLDALEGSDFASFEVIVVDDGSVDGSAGIVEGHPVTLIRLPSHMGAGAARNAGTRVAKGEALLFIDSDCLVLFDTISTAARLYGARPSDALGGTYTPMPYERDFFSVFQSVFINYNETRLAEPDYIAAHALLIGRETFLRSGGFPESFLPIIEDVELSHRLRRSGVALMAVPELMVRHVFRFTLLKSLKNAYRKSKFWTMYSLEHRDLHRDSGTASMGLKVDVLCWCACAAMLALGWYAIATVVLALNAFINRGLLQSFFKFGCAWFGIRATLYYLAIYPLPVGLGGIDGVLRRRPCTPR